MKNINKIVISDTEPQKDCLWIKDNAFYIFGSNGWKKVNDYTETLNKMDNKLRNTFSKVKFEPVPVTIPIIFADKFAEISGGSEYTYESSAFADNSPIDGFYIKDLEDKVLYVPRVNRLDYPAYHAEAVSLDGEQVEIYIQNGKIGFITSK